MNSQLLHNSFNLALNSKNNKGTVEFFENLDFDVSLEISSNSCRKWKISGIWCFFDGSIFLL